jgi:hypothetical protein
LWPWRTRGISSVAQDDPILADQDADVNRLGIESVGSGQGPVVPDRQPLGFQGDKYIATEDVAKLQF